MGEHASFVSILHTNDLHGKLDSSTIPFLMGLREATDLYFDSGDGVKVGNLAVPVRQEVYWDCLRRLRCDASTLGNRESHVLKAAFAAKTAGRATPVVVANMTTKDGGLVFPASKILEWKGRRIGVVGTMVAMVTSRMATAPASQYLWTDPFEAASAEGARIKADVDALFLLSHCGYKNDLRVAELGVFDVVFGGHSHTVLPEPEKHGDTWVVQGGSHARYAGMYRWDVAQRRLEGGLRKWLSA